MTHKAGVLALVIFALVGAFLAFVFSCRALWRSIPLMKGPIEALQLVNFRIVLFSFISSTSFVAMLIWRLINPDLSASGSFGASILLELGNTFIWIAGLEGVFLLQKTASSLLKVNVSLSPADAARIEAVMARILYVFPIVLPILVAGHICRVLYPAFPNDFVVLITISMIGDGLAVVCFALILVFITVQLYTILNSTEAGKVAAKRILIFLFGGLLPSALPMACLYWSLAFYLPWQRRADYAIFFSIGIGCPVLCHLMWMFAPRPGLHTGKSASRGSPKTIA